MLPRTVSVSCTCLWSATFLCWSVLTKCTLYLRQVTADGWKVNRIKRLSWRTSTTGWSVTTSVLYWNHSSTSQTRHHTETRCSTSESTPGLSSRNKPSQVSYASSIWLCISSKNYWWKQPDLVRGPDGLIEGACLQEQKRMIHGTCIVCTTRDTPQVTHLEVAV